MPSKTKKPTSFHWGSYYAEIENEKIDKNPDIGPEEDELEIPAFLRRQKN